MVFVENTLIIFFMYENYCLRHVLIVKKLIIIIIIKKIINMNLPTAVPFFKINCFTVFCDNDVIIQVCYTLIMLAPLNCNGFPPMPWGYF